MPDVRQPQDNSPDDEALADSALRRRIVWSAIAFEGSLIVVAAAMALWLRLWPLPGVVFSGQGLAACGWPLLLGAAAVVPMVAGLLLIDRFPLGPFRELKELMEQHVVPLFATARLWQLALISAFAGVGEEMLFRGLLQIGVSDWLGPPNGLWIGLIVASLAFGVCHWLTDNYFILAVAIGVYFGGLLLATDNVVAPIVAHGLYDFVALVYLTKRPLAH